MPKKSKKSKEKQFEDVVNALENKLNDTEKEIFKQLWMQHGDAVYPVFCAVCHDLIHFYQRDETHDVYFDTDGEEYDGSDREHFHSGRAICDSCAEFDHVPSMVVMQLNGEDDELEEINIQYHNSEVFRIVENGSDELDQFNDTPTIKAIEAIMRGTYYQHSDAWRGGYAVKLENENDAVYLDDLQILYSHHSKEMEKRRKELLERVIKKLNIPLFVAILPSSNVFCTNGDYFCRAQNAEIMKKVMTKLNELTDKDDPRWRIGVLFADLQESPATKNAVKKLDATMKKLKHKPR